MLKHLLQASAWDLLKSPQKMVAYSKSKLGKNFTDRPNFEFNLNYAIIMLSQFLLHSVAMWKLAWK